MFTIHVNTLLDFLDFFRPLRTSLRMKEGWLSAWETRVGHVPENRSCQCPVSGKGNLLEKRSSGFQGMLPKEENMHITLFSEKYPYNKTCILHFLLGLEARRLKPKAEV